MQLHLTRLDYKKESGQSSMAIGLWCLSADEIRNGDFSSNVLNYELGGRAWTDAANSEITRAHKSIFPAICEGLNRFHGTNNSEKYWNVVVGFWLRQFLDVLYERREVLLEAEKKCKKSTIQLIPEELEWVAADTDDYSVGVFSDRLNHQLFGQIVRAKNLNFVVTENPELATVEKEKIGRPSRSNGLKQTAFWLSAYLSRPSRVILMKTYFSKKLLLTLGLRFFSVPLLGTPKLTGGEWLADKNSRKRLKFEAPNNSSQFEKLALGLISRNIPIVFAERFRDLVDLANRTRPKRASVLITGNGFAAHEVYKLWAAEFAGDPAKQHVILQHGGNYGHSRVLADEDFETSTADTYLTSGWKTTGKENVQPFIASCRLGGIGDYQKIPPAGSQDGRIYWVLPSLMRYVYTSWSAAQGPRFLDFLEEQATFLQKLAENVRSLTTVRNYHHDYGWNDLVYLREKAGDFVHDTERKPLRKCIASSRLVVFSYESTSMMESMAMNHPTIAFWNPQYWAWRNSAASLLQTMQDAGIYHETPESAAEFLNKFDDRRKIDQWWKSDAVQSARLRYCEDYARTSDQEHGLWEKKILSLLNVRKN